MNNIANIGEDFFGGSHFLASSGGVAQLVSILVNNLILIGGVAMLFIIVYSGLIMVTGAGSPQQNERARNSLTAGIIGFIIIVAAWLITRIIEASTGVSILG